MIHRGPWRGDIRRAPRQPIVEQERRAHIVFALAGVEHAFPLLSLREILQVDGLRSVPGAPPALNGVMSLRGERLPVLDLAVLVGLGASHRTLETCVLVVEGTHADRPALLGLLVDGVRRILDLASGDMTPAPRLQAPFTIDFVSMLARVDVGLVPVLDLERLLAWMPLGVAARAGWIAALPADEHQREADSSRPSRSLDWAP